MTPGWRDPDISRIAGNDYQAGSATSKSRTATEADARLSAAAPDLLAALEALVGEIDESECGAGTSVIVGRARAAIRKAKGGAE